ncbi:hypothetical protein BKA64DRAFT_240416 [Cadophora sp. MPI-SDFR-AT-0126]|nr:hypothetical protein BKA64DRAFT_240416 [Leotiomycetes sp. MPI-SDFR-AT-0126]
MGNIFSQCYPPAPVLTEQNCPDLTGKVYIVTGGASGIGFRLVKILYQKNATVYIAGRSLENAERAKAEAKSEVLISNGKIECLFLDLADLATIKKSADEFMAREQRLDILWNNAAVGQPPAGSQTAQGYELQLGTNCLGPFLFTHLLHPILLRTAKSSPTASVRVCWAGSLTIDLDAPEGGIDIDDLHYATSQTQARKYAQSKCGNLFLASEFAKRTPDEGIISVAFNPGNLRTPLLRHLPAWKVFFMNLLLHDPIYGSYTELFSGLSSEITPDKNGSYIMPWGRFAPIRPDIQLSLLREVNGGNGKAAKFWDWCATQCTQYM